jgi:thiosulfate reductase/polysulfide reductase chain A
MPYELDEKTGRRRFLKKVLGLGAGGAAVSSMGGCGPSFGSKEHGLPVNVAAKEALGREAGEWIPSCCNMCGGQSGILCHVVDGKLDKIEPNHWNPNNYGNISTDFFEGYTEEHGCAEGGALCPKGNAGIMQLYDPDRVKRPLKRSNPDRTPGADPRWQEISWDQALDEIATELRKLRDAGEVHKLLWISEDHSFTHIQDDFLKLYGSPNYGMHSNLCDVARKASFLTVVGHDRPLADFIQSKYILLFGWNPTSAIKWVYLPRIITRAVERGARLVVVDPYLSDTAAKAHEWVSLRPGTDGALALALGHVIVRDALYDKEFVARWTVGFDGYADLVKSATPSWAEGITSVRAPVIERLARELATTKPALVDVWSGPGQHSNGVQGGRAIAMLNTLIGSWDRPGGMMIPGNRGNKHVAVKPSATASTTLKQPRFDELDKFPLGHKSGVYTRLFSNLAEEKGPYKPKVMFCVFQNPMMSVPGSETVAAGIAKLDKFVVIDTMLSETAMLADYVLPGTVYLERYDLNTHWVTWPVVGLRQPVVKPLFGQPAEYEIVAELGRRLGLKDAEGKDFFRVGPLSGQPIENLTAWYEDYLSNELKNGAPGITLDELKSLPGAVWVDKGGTKYEKYAAPVPAGALASAWYDGAPGPDGRHRDGTLVYDKEKTKGGTVIGIVVGGAVRTGFSTPSRRVEFSSARLGAMKDARGRTIDPLPVYTPRDWQPDKDYPLYLINWKEASHTHSRTQNNPWLLELKPFAPLVIHPDTAARLRIRDGGEVWVESAYGKVRAKVHVTKRIHPEVVGLQHGFGHTALGKLAKGQGTSDAVLRPTLSDPLSGMALHKEACVRVRPV